MRIQEIAKKMNKEGVVFIEEGPGGLQIEMKVVDPAFWEEDQLKWTATPTYSTHKGGYVPVVQPYLITKGLEHYGPKIKMVEDSK